MIYTDITSTVDDYPKVCEFFDGESLQYDNETQGQRVTDTGVVMGLKAGPRIDVENVCHELAHLVEIDKERVLVNGYGLKLGTVYEIANTFVWEYSGTSHIDREIRVWAIQSHILSYIGKPLSDYRELAKVAVYLPNYENALPAKLATQALTREQSVTNYFAEVLEITTRLYSMDWIKEEVERKRAYIQSVMG